MSRLAWQIAAMIKITDRVCIPFDEIRFITSRSSGPGGQHVNTADTRVTLLFDVEKTDSLSRFEKVAVKGKLRRRIDKRGVLQVSSQKFRSQKRNKEAAIDRFIELMQWALKPVTPRKGTSVPKSAKRRRLERKKRTKQKKRDRSLPDFSGEY